jgi:hypothetical protein
MLVATLVALMHVFETSRRLGLGTATIGASFLLIAAVCLNAADPAPAVAIIMALNGLGQAV